MNAFFELRWQAYKDVRHDGGARKVLGWDVGRVVAWFAFFALGCTWHASFSAMGNTAAAPFMIGVTTFGTFLASFVLSVMTNAGKRTLGAMSDADGVRQMEDRLRWLMSDQLIMVVSALATAICGLAWLAVGAAGLTRPVMLTAAVMAFAGLAGLNALRLPFQVWELQISALIDERKRAFAELNKQTEQRFRD